MDITCLGFDNFNREVTRQDQILFLLCMPQNRDFPEQVQALVECCRRFNGRLTPGVLDEAFIEPFRCRYEVRGTPTFLIFNAGNELDRLLGLHSSEALTRFAEETLGSKRAGIL